eukprot:6452341-Amphidinium_carterae.1
MRAMLHALRSYVNLTRGISSYSHSYGSTSDQCKAMLVDYQDRLSPSPCMLFLPYIAPFLEVKGQMVSELVQRREYSNTGLVTTYAHELRTTMSK